MPSNASHPRIVIVGAGLAGMAAAVALQSAGLAVTLLEARRALGGRASSFEDPASGEILDNCQHVLLGCCTNLIDFYRRVNVLHLIRFEPSIHFLDPVGREHRLYATAAFPAPLHLGHALLHFSLLTMGEKFALSRAMLAMMRMDRAERGKLDDMPFGRWLDDHKQPKSLDDKFYSPVLTGSLNENPREASAAYAIQVFQDALLSNSAGWQMGIPNCPLSELYARIPCDDVRLGARVADIQFVDGQAAGIQLQSGEFVSADYVILATNHHNVARWIPADLAARDGRFGNLDKLESVPILGVHLFFDRPVMTLPHAALIAGPLQWLFRKDEQGRNLHGVISAARDFVDVAREEMIGRFLGQIQNLFPAAREAKLLHYSIVVEKRATFSPKPEVDRPDQSPPAGGIANIYLAGDYTRTGWPATMEGAVRSGYLAAGALAGQILREKPPCFLEADLPRQWPARLLASLK